MHSPQCAQSTILNFSLQPRSVTRSHVAALSPQPFGVDPGDEVEGVHVAVHAHRDAFLEILLCDNRVTRTKVGIKFNTNYILQELLCVNEHMFYIETTF